MDNKEEDKKKMGRPTDSLKDTMLRVRLNDEYVKKLDEISSKKRISKSEIVRNGIDIQYDNL